MKEAAIHISPVSLVGGSGMIAVAIGFVLFAMVRRLDWKYLGLGALLWFVTVALKFAVAIPGSPWVLNQTNKLPGPWGTVIFTVYVGLLTGVFEVALVWLLLRYTKLGDVDWQRALAFGIGFGAIEAFLLGIAALAVAIIAIRSPGLLSKPDMEHLARTDHVWYQLAPISERFFACLGHIATNIMIFYAVVRRTPRWFWLAFLFKTAIDAAAALVAVKGYTSLGQIWAIEAVVALWGIIGWLIVVWLQPSYSSDAAPQAADPV